jgi:uncharacterized membrane protein
MNKKKQSIFLYIIFVFFGLLYADISIINHYNFRTSAHDLGIYNNAMYDYSHFRMNHAPFLSEKIGNQLADHFELLPVIFSPLSFLFGSYTLLLIQIAAILFGGYGIYLIFKKRFSNPLIPFLALIYFFMMWGIFSALAFDYHNNVVGAMFVPWLIYYFNRKKFKQATFFFILLVISKENMALWAVFIGIGLFLSNFRDKEKRRFAISSSIASLVYFIVVVALVMPALSNSDGEYFHNDFSALGKNLGDVFLNIVTHPFKSLALLFENNSINPDSHGIKLLLFIIVLLSGGVALFLKPQYLFMLLPVFGQKLFNDDYLRWGINAQYSIEFAPVLTIAVFAFLADNMKERKQLFFSLLFLISTIAASVITLDLPPSSTSNPSCKRFYQKSHYKTPYNVDRIYEALACIPADASVSAQTLLVPHLAFRNYIRLYPRIDDANYIALVDCEDIYPMTKDEYRNKREELLSSNEWKEIYHKEEVLVLKRIAER